MADKYKKISDLPHTQSPSTAASFIITDGNAEFQLPLTALLQALGLIDREITNSSQLPAEATAGMFKFFVNPNRDKIECWEYRADNKWHRIL